MNIAVFCSGSGTNLQAIIDAVTQGKIKANLSLVLSDNPESFALVRAKRAKIKTVIVEPKNFPKRIDYDKEIIKHMRMNNMNLIVLAGFMRILTPYFVRMYKDKILNIHPALLPSFKGTRGVEDALNYGVKITGPTLHFVDEKMDHGPIILQRCVEVRDDDTVNTLSERIHKQEHIIYPEAIRLFVEGKLVIEGRRVRIKK